MPVVADEAAAYGYEDEDRHFVRAFLGKEAPRLTFDDGLEVVQLLMAAYQSAEQGRTLAFPPPASTNSSPRWHAERGGSDRGAVKKLHRWCAAVLLVAARIGAGFRNDACLAFAARRQGFRLARLEVG